MYDFTTYKLCLDASLQIQHQFKEGPAHDQA